MSTICPLVAPPPVGGEDLIKLVNSGKARCFCNGRFLLHALGCIRVVELVAGRSDLRIDIKRSNTEITDIRCLNVIIADCVGHIGVGRRIMEPERASMYRTDGGGLYSPLYASGNREISSI